MIKNVLVFIANGTEEIEAVVFIDIMRRAGMNVTVVGETDIVHCSRDVKIIPDLPLHKLNENKLYDLIYLPGGSKGVENLMNIPKVELILKNHKENNKKIAAICAAPTILDFFNIFEKDAKITSHPSVANILQKYNYSENKVVESHNIISSRGAGTVFDLSFYIIEQLLGQETAQKIKDSIVYK
jgi:protein DJ-1